MKLIYMILLKTAVLLFTNASTVMDDSTESIREEKLIDSCPIKLKTNRQCDGEECPYQISLPPMTIQLPKQFQLIEKTLREVQNLKEVVNKMKTCQDCKLQADDNLEKDSNEFLPPGTNGPTDDSKIQDNKVKELQNKVSRLSASLKNAENHINSLQGQLEQIKLINMGNVESYVDRKIANLTIAVNSLDHKCVSSPALQPNSVIQLPQGDCSNYFAAGARHDGIYKITPDPQNESFDVYCDMESMGGGWTVFQTRQDGSTNFNRTWNEYKNGFGNLSREFWLGNDKINLLTKSKVMELRIELEDFNGVRKFAKYGQFYVANERLKYRLSIGSYSGTAGDALNKKRHNHDQRFFTTPDIDNDRYILGNCGAYYSSGWWFDACFAANLNGKYYHKKYQGIHNGIYWDSWPGVSDNLIGYRQSFKKVKMMMRPKGFVQ
ncbi:fibroleukin [Rhineura floridana]|uniref:fibroleukin n=1 Tax=Rhineura floridana TaxID=261503 RepID=UPI002AC7ED94|nr:fibroleukin [Rhineura floridana]